MFIVEPPKTDECSKKILGNIYRYIFCQALSAYTHKGHFCINIIKIVLDLLYYEQGGPLVNNLIYSSYRKENKKNA